MSKVFDLQSKQPTNEIQSFEIPMLFQAAAIWIQRNLDEPYLLNDPFKVLDEFQTYITEVFIYEVDWKTYHIPPQLVLQSFCNDFYEMAFRPVAGLLEELNPEILIEHHALSNPGMYVDMPTDEWELAQRKLLHQQAVLNYNRITQFLCYVHLTICEAAKTALSKIASLKQPRTKSKKGQSKMPFHLQLPPPPKALGYLFELIL